MFPKRISRVISLRSHNITKIYIVSSTGGVAQISAQPATTWVVAPSSGSSPGAAYQRQYPFSQCLCDSSRTTDAEPRHKMSIWTFAGTPCKMEKLREVVQNILDEPIPERVKQRLLKPLRPSQGSNGTLASLRRRREKRKRALL